MDLFHRLPPDAQQLVRRFTPHPCVDVLYTSKNFLRRWGIANDWYADWQERRDVLLRDGLPVRITGAEIRGDFFAVYVEASEQHLIRPHAVRSFDLHITLGFTNDWWAGTAEEAMERINARWRGRDVVLHVAWMGSGGAVFLHDYDAVALDTDIAWLHRRGWYSDRGLHISL